MYEDYPFWFTFLTNLGFRVILSEKSNRKTYEKGMESMPSESVCYPAKLSHGHIMSLIHSGIKTIFYPCMPYSRKEFEKAENKYNCPIVISYPEVLRNNVEELKDIIKRTSRVLDMPISDDAAYELATRSRGTPRIANRLFKRVRDFAMVKKSKEITLKITEDALDRLKVDKIGLDNTDRELLLAIINKFNGGPVGIDAISSTIGEEVTTIEDVYEPYLLQLGLMKRTSRGRVATDKAYEVLGIAKK